MRREARRDDILRDVARHVAGGAVHLGWIFSGKRAAAVTAVAAVGVDDNLAAGEAGVAHGTAGDEAAGGIDVDFGVLVEHCGGHDGLDDFLDDGFAANRQCETLSLCCVEMTTVSTRDGAAVDVFDGDLGFSVGAEEINDVLLADFGELVGEAVRQLDRHGHQFGSLVASVAEHQALVAGAAGINAHGDVGRLLA